MKKRLVVFVAVAVAASMMMFTGRARAATPLLRQAGSVAGQTHVLLTRQLVDAQRQLGISTGCLGTLSPGCLPIPLMYNGGPVEASGSRNFLIFWEPSGSYVASNYNSTLGSFFSSIGGSSLYGIASQYYQGSGSSQQYIANSAALGGSTVDTSAYPSSTLQDSDIQNEVVKEIKANNWPTGIGDEYFVFLAKGENECMSGSCSFSTYCAYHGNFTSNSSTVLYAAMPYAGTDLSGCGIQNSGPYPNGADTDAEISVASHELMETVTDPQLNAWYDLSGAEIGDKCAYTYGPTSSDGSDITLAGHPYIVQEEFDNSSLGCSI